MNINEHVCVFVQPYDIITLHKASLGLVLAFPPAVKALFKQPPS